MSQTTYTLDNKIAHVGQVADLRNAVYVSAVADGDIPFGRLVEYSAAGKVRLPQATTLGKLVGMAVYDETKEPYGPLETATNASGWKSGSMVRILRKGSGYVEYSGTAPTGAYVAANVRHASDDTNTEAQYRGTVTQTTTSVTAGQEKSASPEGMVAVKTNATMSPTGALMELNFPA